MTIAAAPVLTGSSSTRASLTLLTAYLAGTTIVALWLDRGAGLFAAHLAMLAAVIGAAAFDSHPRAAQLVRWLPLLLLPALYVELASLVNAAGGFHDRVVIGWEAAIFGTQPAQTLAGALPYPLLSELLHLCYLSYYAIIFVPPIVLAYARRDEAFAETVFAVTLPMLVCFVAFIAFPVEGPRYLWPAPPGIPHGPVRSLVLGILERGSSRGTAFPSAHVAVSVAQALTALRLQRRVGIVVSVLAVGLAVGAVYGGFHYAIDTIVGAVLGAALALGAPFCIRAAASVTAGTRIRAD